MLYKTPRYFSWSSQTPCVYANFEGTPSFSGWEEIGFWTSQDPVSLQRTGRIWASSCILPIYPVSFLDLSACVNNVASSLLLIRPVGMVKTRTAPKGLHSPLLPARYPPGGQTVPLTIQNNIAGISPDGRARPALNWRSSATEVWFPNQLSFYISLLSVHRK